MMVYMVEEFDLECLEIVETFDISPFRDDKIAQFLYGGAYVFPCIRVDGNFKVLKNEYKGVSFYQLEIDTESEFFKALKVRVKELCGHGNVIVGNPNSFDPYKPDQADWDTNVSTKIYSSIVDRVNIPIWELTKSLDKPKKREIDINKIANEWFYGSCVISIRDLLLTDYFNVINLEAGEILVKEMNPRKSYFKEYKTLRRN